jgi:hypothetical protein
VLLTTIFAAPTAGAATVRAGAVRLSVADVRPNSPTISQKPAPLDISLTLVNTTGQMLRDVTVSGARSDPITTQAALDSAIAQPKPPSSDLVAPLANTYKVTMAPHATVDLDFRTTYDVPTDADLCLCHDAIYPLYFTADYTPRDGATVRLATAQTYIPSFTKQPDKAQIAWVWPLLDRPHRQQSDTLFLDDDLAAEIAPGGRLDQLLSVLESVGRTVPMTILTDPDLIDELAIMSAGYQVRHGTGRVPGTGAGDASAWLARLRAVLAMPNIELAFTPFGDPAVETSARAGLTWTTAMPGQMQARVSTALGGRTPPTDIAWPANLTISNDTLSTLIGQGTKTVLVSDKTMPGGSNLAVVPDALAPVRTSHGSALGAVTSSNIDRWVKTVLQPGGPGLGALPQLVAQMALRVEKSPDRSHFIVVVPPRELSVDPAVAERAILATAHTVWSKPLPLRAATSVVTPVSHGGLRKRVEPPSFPAATEAALDFVSASLPGLNSLIAPANRQTYLGNVPTAMQRAQSTSLLSDTAHSVAYSQRLETSVRVLRNSVVLVRPSNGTYTLPSRNSRLPITISNRLAATVTVVVNASSTPGFRADPVTRSIAPNSTVQVRVPTQVDRVGRFEVRVDLSAPDGLSLSNPITLTVHSTALGTVGVVITVVAGVVLAAALLIRFVRRMRRRRRPPTNPPAPEPVPVATVSP